MTKFYETKEFKALQRREYARIKAAGFDDIEDRIEWRLKGRAQSLESAREHLPKPQALQPLDELLDSDNPRFRPGDSHRAAYSDAEENVVLEALKANEIPFRHTACWILAAQHVNRRDILTIMREVFGYRNLTERRLKYIIGDMEQAIKAYVDREYEA